MQPNNRQNTHPKTSITERAASGLGLKSSSSTRNGHSSVVPAPVRAAPPRPDKDDRPWWEQDGLEVIWVKPVEHKHVTLPPQTKPAPEAAAKGTTIVVEYTGLPQGVVSDVALANMALDAVIAQQNEHFRKQRVQRKKSKVARLFGETGTPTPRSFWAAQKAAKRLVSEKRGRSGKGWRQEVEEDAEVV